jgi:hypothetical protein
MKKILLLCLLLVSLSSSSQAELPYHINSWYNVNFSPSLSSNQGFSAGVQAHLALDNKVFALGYNFNNYYTRFFTRLSHQIYFTPGFHLPVNDRLNFDVMLGPSLHILLNREQYQYIPSLLPRIQSSFKLKNNWGITGGVALNVVNGIETANFIQLSMGLRFGNWPNRAKLKPNIPEASEKRKAIKQGLIINTLWGSHAFGWVAAAELGLVNQQFLLKTGYFNNVISTANGKLDGYYLLAGAELQKLRAKLYPHFALGVGNAIFTQEETFESLGTPIISFRSSGLMGVVQVGLSYSLTDWLYLNGQYNLLVSELFSPKGLGQLGLQFRLGKY